MANRARFALIAGVAGLAIVITALYIYFGRSQTSAVRLGSVLVENGFVELRPPSNLFLPGTWVEVLDSDPLHLSIVCQPREALGLQNDELIASSESMKLSFEASLSPQFSVDAELMNDWKANLALDAIRSVQFTLSNLKLLEVPDSVVFDGFDKRTTNCNSAIKFRLTNEKPISMVKSVLVADVEYLIDFQGDLDANAKAQAAKALALEIGVTTDTTETNKTTLTGRQLVWGIRDDVALANFGYDLASTGSGDSTNSILTGKGPVTQIISDSQARRSFPDKDTLIAYDMRPLKQSTTMGCWATVYAMMRSWKDGLDWSVGDAISDLGSRYVDYFVNDSGLPGGSEREFVRDAEMVAKPPANYFLWGFREMLESYGPLWIILGDGINSHAVVLLGMYGSSLEETRETYEETVMEFIDPLKGNYRYQSAMDFLQEFEREAVVLVDSKADDIPLRWQILHWP